MLGGSKGKEPWVEGPFYFQIFRLPYPRVWKIYQRKK